MTGSRPARGSRPVPVTSNGARRSSGARRSGAATGTARSTTRAPRSGTAALEERIAELEARLRSMESRAGSQGSGMMGPAHLLAEVLPAEAMRHFKNAGREQLLGFRALVDHWLRRLEQERHAPDREEIAID